MSYSILILDDESAMAQNRNLPWHLNITMAAVFSINPGM